MQQRSILFLDDIAIFFKVLACSGAPFVADASYTYQPILSTEFCTSSTTPLPSSAGTFILASKASLVRSAITIGQPNEEPTYHRGA
jgi:hypothetical protein